MEKDIKRFESFYKIINGCFVWQNFLDKDGYGAFYFKKKLRRAHRVAYFFKNGDIPVELLIDHICRNRACVNPEHLRLITPLINTVENSNSIQAMNKNKTHCKFGHLFDRRYETRKGSGKYERYCSICQAEKTKRLRKKWREEADSVLC